MWGGLGFVHMNVGRDEGRKGERDTPEITAAL